MVSMGSMVFWSVWCTTMWAWGVLVCAWCITVTLYSPWHQDTIKLINSFAAPFIFRYGLLFDTLLWHLSGSIKKSLEDIMGSSEKFSLKWNDFEKNVSKSFSQMRQQTGLFDVTLVSSDQKQVSAHRLVLSACSDFFKNILNSLISGPEYYLWVTNKANKRTIKIPLLKTKKFMFMMIKFLNFRSMILLMHHKQKDHRSF